MEKDLHKVKHSGGNEHNIQQDTFKKSSTEKKEIKDISNAYTTITVR